jgi:hypothetical protein
MANPQCKFRVQFEKVDADGFPYSPRQEDIPIGAAKSMGSPDPACFFDRGPGTPVAHFGLAIPQRQ